MKGRGRPERGAGRRAGAGAGRGRRRRRVRGHLRRSLRLRGQAAKLERAGRRDGASRSSARKPASRSSPLAAKPTCPVPGTGHGSNSALPRVCTQRCPTGHVRCLAPDRAGMASAEDDDELRAVELARLDAVEGADERDAQVGGEGACLRERPGRYMTTRAAVAPRGVSGSPSGYPRARSARGLRRGGSGDPVSVQDEHRGLAARERRALRLRPRRNRVDTRRSWFSAASFACADERLREQRDPDDQQQHELEGGDPAGDERRGAPGMVELRGAGAEISTGRT